MLRQKLEALWVAEGKGAGLESGVKESHGRRLANLANKGKIFRELLTDPYVLEAVGSVLGDDFNLMFLNARDVTPHTGNRQKYHCDTNSGGVPGDFGAYIVATAWMLDDFTEDNGATRFVVGSHLSNMTPKEGMEDLFVAHPDEIFLEGKAGDVAVFNGHAWHAGGPNTTDGHRLGLFGFFLKEGAPRRKHQKQKLSPEVLAELTDQERDLLIFAE